MIKKYFTIFAFTLIPFLAKTDEGMWIPMFLGELNEAEMQAMGLRITADDIYNENHSSLKDAIVIFGSGCTGEVISSEGLLLTNHHCGKSNIQSHSSLEHDYLTDGFWAMNRSEELSNPGLKVTFLVSMREVTMDVLSGVTNSMNENDRFAKITENINQLKEQALKETHYSAEIKSFFNDNRYFLFINEVFEDVRLVGAPPSNIGNFGGDTDNWVWPRHTGDFSLFRIYADSANNPAKYDENNVPYKPKKHLSISTKGFKEGDFTFVFGYPGSTQEYIPSYGIDMVVNVLNPVRISLREQKLDIYNTAMNDSLEVRIKYAAKRSGIANGWKKSIGESRGIKRLKTIDEKRVFELEFENWVNASETRKEMYGGLLSSMAETYDHLKPLNLSLNYLRESIQSIEIIRFARTYAELIKASNIKNPDQAEIDKLILQLTKSAESHFRNYQAEIDKEIFVAMISDYCNNNPQQNWPETIQDFYQAHKGNFNDMAEMVFNESIFASAEKVAGFLNDYKPKNYKQIEKDAAYKIASGAVAYADQYLLPDIKKSSASIDSLMRIYMKARMEMQPMKKFYPDANFTLRITYGNVKGYQPDDAVRFNYFTTLEGIMEKEDPDIYDYVVEEKLKDLYQRKDFGPYADADGKMHVCFTATNHTSGGNSGSPVLDADGNLIGLNFDRCWEGTMSDLVYDISQCRNIALDIRYCLFIIDKFAGASHLVDEMTILEVKDQSAMNPVE
jgi:hypothetical protein